MVADGRIDRHFQRFEGFVQQAELYVRAQMIHCQQIHDMIAAGDDEFRARVQRQDFGDRHADALRAPSSG